MQRFQTAAVIVALTAAILASSVCAASETQPRNDQPFSGQVTYVVDGDSLYIRGTKKQIRLWGIDAPEHNERGYRQATETLRAVALHRQIKCYRQDTDKYGRTVARCVTLAGDDISRKMLDSGLVREYCWFSKGFYGSC